MTRDACQVTHTHTHTPTRASTIPISLSHRDVFSLFTFSHVLSHVRSVCSLSRSLTRHVSLDPPPPAIASLTGDDDISFHMGKGIVDSIQGGVDAVFASLRVLLELVSAMEAGVVLVEDGSEGLDVHVVALVPRASRLSVLGLVPCNHGLGLLGSSYCGRGGGPGLGLPGHGRSWWDDSHVDLAMVLGPCKGGVEGFACGA